MGLTAIAPNHNLNLNLNRNPNPSLATPPAARGLLLDWRGLVLMMRTQYEFNF
jgi:hypothetical protein